MTPSVARNRLGSVNLIELAPVRTAKWEEVDGRVVIERPRPPRFLRAPLEWIAQTLASKRIRLDEIGGFVWKTLDGRITVAEIVEKLRGQFGSEVEPAEERLGQMIRLLRSEGLVGYPGWDQDLVDSGRAPEPR
jgi:hypothetical protein